MFLAHDQKGATATLICGDALAVLKTFPSDHFHCCVTSPPYFKLRDYDTATWEGGDDHCKHLTTGNYRNDIERDILELPANSHFELKHRKFIGKCGKCGARSTDFQIGIERTVAEYVSRLVEVFSEVRRVLRPDGTVFVVMGDKYYTRTAHARTKEYGTAEYNTRRRCREAIMPSCASQAGYKFGDLMMIPAQLAIALRKDGWFLRFEKPWHKPSVTPESVKDRPTKAHYYFDQAVIKVPSVNATKTVSLGERSGSRRQADGAGFRRSGNALNDHYAVPAMRNGRTTDDWTTDDDDWVISPDHSKIAHYAAFPREIARRCILLGSPLDGVILDPFSGTATTGVVAVQLGRQFTGIELNGKYAEMSRDRFRDQLGVEVKIERRGKVMGRPPSGVPRERECTVCHEVREIHSTCPDVCHRCYQLKPLHKMTQEQRHGLVDQLLKLMGKARLASLQRQRGLAWFMSALGCTELEMNAAMEPYDSKDEIEREVESPLGLHEGSSNHGDNERNLEPWNKRKKPR